MVDLKRSARLLALPLLLLAPPMALSETSGGVPTQKPCSSENASAAGACQPEAANSASTQAQPAPADARAEKFAPSTVDPDRTPLKSLTPTAPAPQPSGGAGLSRTTPEKRAAGEIPPAKAPVDAKSTPTPSPAEIARREKRLHQGLKWDCCGPKPGYKKLGGADDAQLVNEKPIDIAADRVDYDRNADLIELQGNTEFLQEGRRLEAEHASYDRKNGEVKAAGDIYLEYPGARLMGDRADYNLLRKKGSMDHVLYRFSGNANLRGQADKAWLLSEERSRFRDIVYTTCPPGTSDWSIKASKLELDQVDGLGVARNATIRVGEVPVLYTPYLRFPIDSRRRSGFLIPTVGSSEETGFDLSIPYYWNIAPNMDATITPRYMSSRGVMLDTQFRHLSRFQKFSIDTEFLPRDQKVKEEGWRGALRLKETGHFGPRWSTSVDYAAVSDDTYLQDFGNKLDVTSVRNLGQRADINYSGDGWRILSRFQQFQTVDSTIAPEDRPYGQLPHIEFSLDPKQWNDIVEYQFDAEYDYFDHNSAVHGSRFVAVPSVRLPLRRSYGQLIPRARLYYTAYDLVDQTAGLSATPSHVIPSFDLDGKLIFERTTSLFGTQALQTLEPRLYYLLTGYEDQSETPRFDTTATDFSFASLFRPNRFTGYDRIGDANQLTVGITSRTIANATGDELFSASIGQIYYFDKRRVQLTGAGAESDISSSVAGEVSAHLFKDWTALASLQWSPNKTEQPWEKQAFQLRYAPDKDHLLNLAYRFNQGNLDSEQYEDTDLSFQMPVGSRVKVVGRWLYSLLNDETIEGVAGIEFGRCCWRLRILGQHLKRSANSSGTNSVMLQLELAGLGSFGNQIDKVLERGIYGYQSD